MTERAILNERATSDQPPPEPPSQRRRHDAARDLAATALRFGLVGMLKTALDFATFNLVLLLTSTDGGLMVLVANTAGFSVAVASSFVLNQRFTFRTAPRSRGFRRYVAISLIGLLIYDGALALILLAGDPRGTLALNLAKVVPLGASVVWNFLGYRYFVFEPRTSARR